MIVFIEFLIGFKGGIGIGEGGGLKMKRFYKVMKMM